MKKTQRYIQNYPYFIGAAVVGIAALLLWQGFFSQGGQFSTDPTGLPQATDSQTVVLDTGARFNLTASLVKKTINGRELKMLAYNGTVPGPTIKVHQGSTITVNLTNETDVATTIHSHGVRMDSKFDGVPGMSQDPVQPGQKFAYTLTFPDAGVFWYHPHIREDYAQPLGLYGNFLVTPRDENQWPPVNQEIPLIISDILLDGQGNVVPFYTNMVTHALMGRFGNTMLINGQTRYALNATAGETIRFYLTNAATTRVLNIAIPNTRMKLVGGDNGRVEKEAIVESVILAPSERAVIDVWFDQPGSYQLTHRTPQKTYELGAVTVAGQAPVPSSAAAFDALRTDAALSAYRQHMDRMADKELILTMEGGGMMMQPEGGMHMMPDGTMMPNAMMSADPIEWEDHMPVMNANATAESVRWRIADAKTGQINDDIQWNFKKGDLVKIMIFNNPQGMHPMQHPIHFHGQRFLVLKTNGVPNDNLVWKDTVLVKTGERVEILLDASNPGMWMAHCHIAEHMESGMMFDYRVD